MSKKNAYYKTEAAAMERKDVANDFVMTVVATVMSDFDLDFDGAKRVLERVGFWSNVNNDYSMALQAGYDFDDLLEAVRSELE